MKIIGIDPGINTGIGIYDTKSRELSVDLIKTKIIFPSIPERLAYFTAALNEIIIIEEGITHAIMESTSFWDISFKSRVSASSGALMLLSYMVGAYCHVLQICGIKITFALPSQWKGQINNEVLQYRVQRFFNINIENEHINCALGLIRYYLKEVVHADKTQS